MLVTSALAPAAGAELADLVGMRSLTVLAPERGTTLSVTVWYPAGAGGTAATSGGNAVFRGTHARQDAPLAAGSFPLVLLAHGGLRSALDSGAWIASRLAAMGFVVAAPNPPRLAGAQARAAPDELWLRPADLSATLAAVTSHSSLRSGLDVRAIGALGFQLGGTSALALVGARVIGQAYARACDRPGAAMDCDWFRKNGVDLHGIDLHRAERSNADQRIQAVVAIDSELSDVLEPTSLASISAPAKIFNLGASEAIRAEMAASRLAGAVPRAAYDTVTGASHLDAFGLCNTEGAAILREEGDDAALCAEGQRPRAEIHALLADMIATFFRAHLPRNR